MVIEIQMMAILSNADSDVREPGEQITRAIKLKIQEKHMTLTSLLMFSPEFNLKREFYNISV